MFKKIGYVFNYLKLLFSGVTCQGFVRIDPDVELHVQGKLIFGRGVEIRKDTVIEVTAGATLVFGNNVFVGHGGTIAAHQQITIADNTMIAEYVSIRDHDHAYRKTNRALIARGEVCRPVSIGKNVWLGAKATVTKGVSLGDHAVIGANAVVTKNIPAKTLAVGVPTKIVRKIK